MRKENTRLASINNKTLNKNGHHAQLSQEIRHLPQLIRQWEQLKKCLTEEKQTNSCKMKFAFFTGLGTPIVEVASNEAAGSKPKLWSSSAFFHWSSDNGQSAVSLQVICPT